MSRTNEEAVASCLQCPAHPAVIESVKGNTRAIRWFIGTFMCVVISGLVVFWSGYTKSFDVDRKFEVYVSGQQQRLANIEKSIDRNEKVLLRIDTLLREKSIDRNEKVLLRIDTLLRERDSKSHCETEP